MENILLSMGVLCNVIDGSYIDIDVIQFINNVNDPYIVSLLPHILEYKLYDFVLVMHDHVSA